MTSTKLIAIAALAVLIAVVAVEAKYPHRHYLRGGSRRAGMGMCLRKLCFQCHRYWIKKQTRHRRDVLDIDEAAPNATAEAIAAAQHNIDGMIDDPQEDYEEEEDEDEDVLPEEEEMEEEEEEQETGLTTATRYEELLRRLEARRRLVTHIRKCAHWRRNENRSADDEGARSCARIRYLRRKLAASQSQSSGSGSSGAGEKHRRSKLKRSASTHKARCVRVINTLCCQQAIKQRAQIIGLVVRRH